ncbi:hypothetical protein O4H61_03375 [Roseovarius aestuarii]|nr:hypothetical protein [Roseovarius aestuarii]
MNITSASHAQLVAIEDLPEYPLDGSERLDSHYFVAWERRRWLNSDMRLKGTPECRALYFDLINICYDQQPVATLPDDMEMLSKLVYTDRAHFEALCKLEFGPLHSWFRCRYEGRTRLMHRFVYQILTEALSRRQDNRANTERANYAKRIQRLRAKIAGLHVELAKNDAAVSWIDEWLTAQNCIYRETSWVERGMLAWQGHMADLNHRRVRR